MHLHATCLPNYPSSVIYSSYHTLFGKLRKCSRFIIKSCYWRLYQQMMLNIRILFTDYAIITDFLNLDFCSEHFISIKHRILATFLIQTKNSFLTACMPLKDPIGNKRKRLHGSSLEGCQRTSAF
jgi:hypothetical protein